jgi:SAM-dependent methyltransferase
MKEGKAQVDFWNVAPINQVSQERIGYPTQKPEDLLERVIKASSHENGVVADFFCGGGTTAAVAQRLGRRWIACDQSRVAVAITADRLTRQVEEQTGKLFPVPDFTIEHWGVYEVGRLAEALPHQFRGFVLKCFGATAESLTPNPSPKERGENGGGIHGYKGAIPVWVGQPNPKKGVTAAEVQDFANAIRKTLRYKQDNLRDRIMLAWAFRQDAMDAAERLRRLEQTDLNFIRLEQIRIDSPRFREHVSALSTEHADYENFLTFVQPPKVEVGLKRIAPCTYKFDVSETVVMNAGARIINVQWDFDYGKRFSSTPGYSFVRGAKKEVALQAEYEFPSAGSKRIACKVQDDMGGEGLWTGEIEVS